MLVPRVAERLLERRNRARGKGYVIGSPADPMKVWEALARDAFTALQQLVRETGALQD